VISIDDAVIPLSKQGIDVNPLRRLLSAIANEQSKQAQTIKKLEAQIQSLKKSNPPAE